MIEAQPSGLNPGQGVYNTAPLRRFSTSVPPGRTEYRVEHSLGTEDVIVQTRIAGRLREGGISILDPNTIQLKFGGVLNETIDIVIIG